MTSRTDLLLDGWNQNLQTLERLWQTLPPERITAQPPGIMNHPAWTVAHLNHYHPAILSLARGQTVSDPGQHPDADRYDAGSNPVDDPAAYPDGQALWQAYCQAHEQITAALRESGDAVLDQPPGLVRWADGFGTTARALGYLMVYHEATHIGQVMVWRRAMGMQPLE